MNTTKLREAIIEMQHQRAVLDTAIEQMQKVLAALSDNGHNDDATPVAVAPSNLQQASIPQQGIAVLETNGKPMHIEAIAKRVSEIRGKTVSRASLESSFMRHIKSAGDKARIKRTKPGYFGLTVWPEDSLPL